MAPFNDFLKLSDLTALQLQQEDDYKYETRKLATGLLASTSTLTPFISKFSSDEILSNKMLSPEYFGGVLDPHTESSNAQKGGSFDFGTRSHGVTLLINSSLNATELVSVPDFYRHSMAMTIVYCIAYLLVFAIGLVGNFFVIAVVFRSPRMRTVTNFFIVNLAVADILVIVFCLPATLMSNIFVRKYFNLLPKLLPERIITRIHDLHAE